MWSHRIVSYIINAKVCEFMVIFHTIWADGTWNLNLIIKILRSSFKLVLLVKDGFP